MSDNSQQNRTNTSDMAPGTNDPTSPPGNEDPTSSPGNEGSAPALPEGNEDQVTRPSNPVQDQLTSATSSAQPVSAFAWVIRRLRGPQPAPVNENPGNGANQADLNENQNTEVNDAVAAIYTNPYACMAEMQRWVASLNMTPDPASPLFPQIMNRMVQNAVDQYLERFREVALTFQNSTTGSEDGGGSGRMPTAESMLGDILGSLVGRPVPSSSDGIVSGNGNGNLIQPEVPTQEGTEQSASGETEGQQPDEIVEEATEPEASSNTEASPPAEPTTTSRRSTRSQGEPASTATLATAKNSDTSTNSEPEETRRTTRGSKRASNSKNSTSTTKRSKK